MKRTQLYLEENEHARLASLSEVTGKSVSQLVREAVHQVYGENLSIENKLALVNSAIGIWKDRRFDTEKYIRRLRRGGRRLKEAMRKLNK